MVICIAQILPHKPAANLSAVPSYFALTEKTIMQVQDLKTLLSDTPQHPSLLVGTANN